MIMPLNIYALDINAKSGVLIESSTGKIIYEKNKDDALPPASMTKMMILLLTYEKIDDGIFNYSDQITISNAAESMGGSQVFLEAGKKYSLEVLLKALSVASANDAAYALAENLGGTYLEAIKLMNEKAKEIGMKNTVFKNAHGLDEDGHLSSAYDMALLASKLVKYEDALKFSSIYEDYIKHPNGNSTWIVNTNKLINYYNGLDGLKTGYTEKAGYCITATANQNDMRLIAVVMGNVSNKDRTEDIVKLLNYGFTNFKLERIISKEDDIGTINVKLSKKNNYKLSLKDDITDLQNKMDKSKYSYKVTKKDIKLPISKDKAVGYITLYKNDLKVKDYNLYINEEVKKANFIDLYIRNFKTLISGNN